MSDSEYEQGKPEEPARFVATTAFVEGLAGLCAVALSIIGLASSSGYVILAVATIVLGAALLFETGAISARYSSFNPETHAFSNIMRWSRWGGAFGGMAGMALGILALLGLAPMVLVPVAAIVFGCAHLMTNVTNAHLNAVEEQKFGSGGSDGEMFKEASVASIGVQWLAGVGGVTLGVLALAGISPMALSLVAMLSLGSAFLLNGSIVGSRMVMSRT